MLFWVIVVVDKGIVTEIILSGQNSIYKTFICLGAIEKPWLHVYSVIQVSQKPIRVIEFSWRYAIISPKQVSEVPERNHTNVCYINLVFLFQGL